MINNAVSESILVAGQGGTAVFRQCSFSVGVRNNLILLLVEWFAANDHLQAMELLWCRRVQEVVRQLHKTKSDLDFFLKIHFGPYLTLFHAAQQATMLRCVKGEGQE